MNKSSASGGEALTAAEWDKVLLQLDLTPRQMDIARHLLPGLGDKEIAKALGVSPYTIYAHLRHVYAKHRLQGRVELVSRIFAIAKNP